jgi:hypothetical protein
MAHEPSRLAVDLLEAPKELVQTALDLELAEGTVVADSVPPSLRLRSFPRPVCRALRRSQTELARRSSIFETKSHRGGFRPATDTNAIHKGYMSKEEGR